MPAGRLARDSGRRQAIIRVAAATFSNTGYEATTTKDIADAAGILKGSLYYYFESKEELLFEVIRDVHENWRGRMDPADLCAEDGDPLTRIWAFVYNVVVGTADNAVNAAVLYRNFNALSPQHRAAIVAIRDREEQTLREALIAGSGAGLVREGVDPKVAAMGIVTTCSNLYTWYRPGGRLSPSQLAEELANLAVSGVAADLADVAVARGNALRSRGTRSGGREPDPG